MTRQIVVLSVVVAFLLAMECPVAMGEVIYVDAGASPGGDGTNWGMAYKYLQDALYKPPTGGDEIWVAEGTYRPDEDEGGNVTPGDQAATFQLLNGAAIYGGFAGSESNLDDRDWRIYETILSGDINIPGINSDNSCHVVTGSGTNTTALLDGFTITAGNADGTNGRNGAGMYNDSGSPTLTNCTFSENWAEQFGGGMYNDQSSPTLTNCTFTGNHAGRKYLGGGGGMYNYSGSPTVTNCTFTGNDSTNYGGGMANEYYSSPTLTNCTFTGNDAADYGGAIYNVMAGNPTITNCILWGDTASSGAEIYNYSFPPPCEPNVTYTDIQGGCTGTGNINADPCFVSGPYGDYYLSQIATGQATDSNCVDAGSDTAVNLGMDKYTTRTDGVGDKGTVDMGYHYPTSADINGDGHIDLFDYVILAYQWLQAPSTPSADIAPPGGDGIVDMNDVGVLSDYWLDCFVGKASSPSPADNAPAVDPCAVLNWSPGRYALSHDVYFGTDYNDVNEADITDPNIYMGNQQPSSWDSNNYDANGLELETVYCWRIDEVGARCMRKGNVRSFTTWGEPNSHLVGWWEFEEGSGTDANDSSGNANHGTLNGNPNWVDGKVGSHALDFDGDDYVGVPSDSSLNVHYVTMSAWVKVDNAAPSATNRILDRKMTNTGTCALYLGSDSKWSALIRLNGSESTSRSIDSDNVATTDWTHICGTYDGDKLKLYINAVLQADVDDTDGTIDTDNPDILTIAAYPGPKLYFDGTIDDVRLYDRALTAGEIQQLYQAGL